ncbi:MAG: hypothetical protein QM757_26625 [Paludibaculum sp.]
MPIQPKHSKQELLERPIDEIALERWQRGRPNYRASAEQEFVGDPVVELLEELYDSLNYVQEMVRQAEPDHSVSGRRLGTYRRVEARIRKLIELIREVHNAAA